MHLKIATFRIVRIVLPALFAFFSQRILAFPETIRHGYTSCLSCHVSPSGGGVLTDYGRGLSRELLATWGTESEAKPLYGVIDLPESLKIGGDVRAIQTYRDTSRVRQGKFFLMQADVEAAWLLGDFTFEGTIGRDIGSPDTDDDDKWESRKHYIMGNLESWGSWRVGRFHRNYGLMIPDHSSFVRRGLGWDQGSETYNAEFNLFNESYQLTATAVGGRPDDDEQSSEKGLSLNGVYYLRESFKVGLSYFFGKTTASVGRELFGPYWVLGFTEQLYWMGEIDLVRTAPTTGGLTQGYVAYNRLGYEWMKGWDIYLVQQTKKSDLKQSKSDGLTYGAGLQWSPRPHWILTGQWEKLSNPESSTEVWDSAYFITQFYL